MTTPLSAPETTCLDQPVALIAGVTGGIGSDVARRLARSGWQVAGYARGADKLTALQTELPALHTVVADATQPAEVEVAVKSTIERFGRLDAYVHAVGSILLKPAHLTSLDDWQRVIDLNLNSAFYGLKAAVLPMQAQGGGSIVLISSVAAQAGLPNHEAIAAAKGGVNGLVLAAAASYANKNVRVNAVAPGLVDTPMVAALLGSEQARQMSEKMHPLGKVGRAANVGSLIAWLVSADADWVTGQIWSVDGGMAHLRPKPKV
jgi:NAD(P)-dependent dehydrogenase (short-subunit alcohol dehydrogenase family)